MLSRLASMTSRLPGAAAASLRWLRPLARPRKSKPPLVLLPPAVSFLAASLLRHPRLLCHLSLAR